MSGEYFELWSRSSNIPPERFEAGSLIFSEGDRGADRMFIVRSGIVEISIGNTLVETVHANGMFGEMALVDGEPRSATARACEACELAPIDRKLFILMVDEAPHFALNVMRVMANRLRSRGG
ncbi:MAG: cyclic nucleotide-binding domain-containing protein [Rhodospirillales bacterium]|nr:cyclic nucleotide-binding domain-containing protein [Rhodospirillales bacterium]